MLDTVSDESSFWICVVFFLRCTCGPSTCFFLWEICFTLWRSVTNLGLSLRTYILFGTCAAKLFLLCLHGVLLYRSLYIIYIVPSLMPH